VTCDGRRSAHFEHTVAITADGPEVLTLLDGADQNDWLPGSRKVRT
jgi:methionyl aminopeptidase